MAYTGGWDGEYSSRHLCNPDQNQDSVSEEDGVWVWVESICHRQKWMGISIQWFKRNFATGSLKSD